MTFSFTSVTYTRSPSDVTATDSYRRNSKRIRAGEGLPIEVLQSIQ